MSQKITEAELLEALAEATTGDGPEDARTLLELVGDTGFSPNRVRAALRACHTAGRLVVHYVCRRNIIGQRARVPAYTINAAKKRKRS